jgi:hypothetical protein
MTSRSMGFVQKNFPDYFFIEPDGEPGVQVFAHRRYTLDRKVPAEQTRVSFTRIIVREEGKNDRAVNVAVEA